MYIYIYLDAYQCLLVDALICDIFFLYIFQGAILRTF